MTMRNTQPSINNTPPSVNWLNLDPYRLVLVKYKHTDLATTLMRTGGGIFILYGETKIEPVANVDWIRQNLEFIRYYEPTDKLELSGS